jgi:hypothetical protein
LLLGGLRLRSTPADNIPIAGSREDVGPEGRARFKVENSELRCGGRRVEGEWTGVVVVVVGMGRGGSRNGTGREGEREVL